MSRGQNFYVYILASAQNGTLYIGVTNNLERRVTEHRLGVFESFTKKYNILRLVYFEYYEDVHCAIRREKQLKAGSRKKKIKLIEKENPGWKDLFDEFSDSLRM